MRTALHQAENLVDDSTHKECLEVLENILSIRHFGTVLINLYLERSNSIDSFDVIRPIEREIALWHKQAFKLAKAEYDRLTGED
jgi:hypothetical protein